MSVGEALQISHRDLLSRLRLLPQASTDKLGTGEPERTGAGVEMT